jgi:hypothetical protein
MTTTIRAVGAHELLAYIPYRLRYHPRESVVLVGLAPTGEVGLVARMDARDLADIDDGPIAAAALVRHLIADDADRAFIAVYTETELRGGRGALGVVRAAVEHCREAAEAVVGPVQAWVVSSTGYADLDCVDPSCCPPGGRDLADLTGGLVGAEMVARGVWAAASREEWMRIPAATPEDRDEARRAAAEFMARRCHTRADGAASGRREIAWRRTAFAAWTRARARRRRDDRLGPALVGMVGAGLTCTTVRDAVLLSIIPGRGQVARATVAGGDVDAATAEAIASVMDPACAIAPPPQVTWARGVLEEVVAHGQGGAAALTLLGFLSWWAGDGGQAGERVRAALEVDPGYRLALLLESALAAGVPPGWVRAHAQVSGTVAPEPRWSSPGTSLRAAEDL